MLSQDRIVVLISDYQKYLLEDKHPDTVRSYVADVKGYLKWCAHNGVDMGPVDEERLLKFCRFLFDERNCNRGTVIKKISAVRRYYRFLGYEY